MQRLSKKFVHEERQENRARAKGDESPLGAQQLRLHIPNAGDLGSIPGQGIRSHMP